MLIIMFVFIAGAFMLIARFAILTFLMIVSPIAFASMILPQTRNMSTQWWETFLKQAFFAPAFLLALFVAFTLSEGIGSVLNTASYSLTEVVDSADRQNPGTMEVLILFGISAIGFVVALIVASKFGAYGANAAMNMGQRWSRNAAYGGARYLGWATAGAASATVAYGGRRTIGDRGAAIANSEKLKEAEAKGGIKGYLARQTMCAGSELSKTSFDARQIGGVGKKLGIGEGAKGGIAKSRSDRAKLLQDRAKELEKTSFTDEESSSIALLNRRRLQLQEQLANATTKSERDAIGGKGGSLDKVNQEIKAVTEARNARGDARKLEYAQTLDSEASKKTAWWLDTRSSNREAATEIRKGETSLKKLQKAIQDANKDISDDAAPTTPPPSSGGTGSGGAGTAGGTTTP